jgi:hypothetical protein
MHSEKIAILYICTGKYSVFWQEFYERSQQYLFTEFQKHFFVFTEDPAIVTSDHVSVVFKETKGFPHDSLFRYHYFLEIEQSLLSYDYIYFFNANISFLDFIGEEFLPTKKKSSNLVAVKHAGYFTKHPIFFPYERSPKSLAYLPYKKGIIFGYYWGGVNGGCTAAYIQLCKTLCQWIEADIKNNIMAVFHDESHFNKYINLVGAQIMPSTYGWPENWSSQGDTKILIRDKVILDKTFKKQTTNLLLRVLNILKHLYSGLHWRFKFCFKFTIT